MKEQIQAITNAYKERQLAHFHHLHAHPELSFEEYETSAYIKETLTKAGVTLADGIHGTSVVGILEGSEPGPTIAFRADIDALPVEEDNDLEYKSTVPGKMHACGHDSHTATLLTFAELLAEHRDLIKGKVKFLFQCAEEKLPGGALGLCEDGAIDDVDAVYGLHCSALIPLGEMLSNEGPNSACIGIYEVKVHGKGGHGSSPHQAVNPVPAACALASSINQILAEKASPLEKAVFTVSYINGGQYPNIIPSDVTLGGNIRTFNNELTDELFKQLKNFCNGICAAYGCTYDVTTTVGYPATINKPEETAIVRSAIEGMGYSWHSAEPALGGEDFSYYLLKKPGSFFSVGMQDPDKVATAAPHHNCHFKLDQRGLLIALELELAIYLKELERR